MSYTTQLASFCADLSLSETPLEVKETAKQCILDFLGCVVGSVWMDEEVQRLAGFIRDLGDVAEATVVGLGIRSSCRTTALANGVLAELLKFTDIYGSFHPASCVLPAAVAVADARHSSGKELLAAVIAGYETSMRIAAAIGLSSGRSGFMSTGTVGTFGAAAAAGRLLGLDRSALTNCLGIVGAIMPFSMAEDFFGGHSIMPVIGGQAARTGVEAALLAARGYTGSDRILEGSSNPAWGFCSMAGQTQNLDRITVGLGQQYQMENIGFRAFPCCGKAQTAVEAALDLVGQHRLTSDQVETIVVRSYASVLSGEGIEYPTPSSTIETCQFSIPYLVAAAVKHGHLGPEHFTTSAIHQPEVLALSARVKMEVDPELTRLAQSEAKPAIVEAITNDGRRVSARVDFRKGGPNRPLSESELLAKFERLAASVCDEKTIRACEQMVLRIEDVQDVSELVSAYSGGKAGNR